MSRSISNLVAAVNRGPGAAAVLLLSSPSLFPGVDPLETSLQAGILTVRHGLQRMHQ